MSDGDEITQAYAEAFDAERSIFLQGSPRLEVIQSLPSIGYTVVKVLDNGWSPPGQVTESATGAEFLEIEIAETGDNLTALFRRPLSHLKIGEYAYKLSGPVRQPKQDAIRIWTARCSPTGERLIGSYALATRSGSRLVTHNDEVLRVHA